MNEQLRNITNSVERYGISMISFVNLNRQHLAIREEVAFLETNIRKDITKMDFSSVALHISKLAGLLKMHLIEEDSVLYPNLLKCSDPSIQELSRQYIKEMGNLSDEYTDFKSKYNVSSKITQNIEQFLKESKYILDVLKVRLLKEDNVFYALVQEKKL